MPRAARAPPRGEGPPGAKDPALREPWRVGMSSSPHPSSPALASPTFLGAPHGAWTWPSVCCAQRPSPRGSLVSLSGRCPPAGAYSLPRTTCVSQVLSRLLPAVCLSLPSSHLPVCSVWRPPYGEAGPSHPRGSVRSYGHGHGRTCASPTYVKGHSTPAHMWVCCCCFSVPAPLLCASITDAPSLSFQLLLLCNFCIIR